MGARLHCRVRGHARCGGDTICGSLTGPLALPSQEESEDESDDAEDEDVSALTENQR